MKDRRQINLREYFSYLEMLIEKKAKSLWCSWNWVFNSKINRVWYIFAKINFEGIINLLEKSENAVIERRLFKLIKLIKDKINMYKKNH